MTASTTDEHTPTGDQPHELKRVMGPRLLLLFIVGDILGAGVYAVTGKLAGQVGGIAWLPFLLAFAVATLTAFSYLELVTKFPQAAGAALYAHKAFGIHFVTFLVAFTVVCSGITSASTSSSLLANNLLLGLHEIWGGVPTTSGWALFVALCFMLLLAAINLRGVGESVKFNIVLTLIEMAALAIVIAIGFAVIARGDGDFDRVTVFENPDDKGLFLAVTIATTIAFFAMVGFEDSVNMVEETREPERIFPRMMFTGLGIAAVIYMLVAVSVVVVIPAGDIAAPTNPDAGILIDVVKRGAPDLPIDDFFPFMTVFAVANTALINMLMASRLVYGMARQQVLPSGLGKVLPGRRAPWAAIAFTTALALALIVAVVKLSDTTIGDPDKGTEVSVVSALSGTTALLLLAVFTVVNIACLVLRRDPGDGTSFKAPVVVPVLGAVTCAYLLGPWARLEADQVQYVIAAALLGLGVVLWGVTRIFHTPEGGHFADIEHMDIDPTDDPR
ncbi:APC family permease [Nocardioides humilatus]|uniref:APC family permease n=1 Tax=Nocardioides humilatus TaxID=2607660 RepID=A0A5B1LB36_9ACTN|nr:APC family permease [Nocardioides humilatus]KAA1417951.1 APC family permease [Nocardioides humilatus]